MAESPAELIDAPLLDEKPPGILTLPEIRSLVDACQRREPALVAWLALALFAGIRPQEALRLSWEDVGEKFIEIRGTKAKTRRRRLIPITAQLRAWLDTAQGVGTEISPRGWPARWAALRAAVGLLERWPQNALRHSFASYHFEFCGNEHETARIMGHSPQMLFQHYRALVRPEDARAFFGLLPDASAVAEGVATAKARSDATQEIRRQSAKEWWARKGIERGLESAPGT